MRSAVGRPLMSAEGAVDVFLEFVFSRPKSPRKTPNQRKPMEHVKKPDIDNLAKLVLDVLTRQGWWRDDTQVTMLLVQKRYAGPGDVSGCRIVVHTSE